MPELPEVETVRLGLIPALLGGRLSDVTLYRPNLRYAFAPGFADRLNGTTVIAIDRRAKYLILGLDSLETLVIHLGMTGRFQINHQTEEHPYHYKDGDLKHRHVSLMSHRANQIFQIDYFDPRRFGFMQLYNSNILKQQKWYRQLGVEPLSDALNPKFLFTALSAQKSGLKSLLMRQDLIAGLGNIYVCEALFVAKLHPDHRGCDLTERQAEILCHAIKTILKEAVAKGGSTISDFAATDGELGYFQHQFKVYDRKSQTCMRTQCSGTIEKSVHQGRSTFFCNHCQK